MYLHFTLHLTLAINFDDIFHNNLFLINFFFITYDSFNLNKT